MLDSLDVRLKNWGRHFRNRFNKGHCYSIEGRYRSPQEWGDWETGQPLPPPLPQIDVRDACLIEDAWQVMDNLKLKELLRLYYVFRRSKTAIKHKIRLVESLDVGLLMAHASILRYINRSCENSKHSCDANGYFAMVVQAPVSVYA